MRRMCVSLLLLLPTLVLAQTPPDVSLPSELSVKPGRLVKITATLKDPTLTVYWDTGGLTPGVDFDLIKLDNSSIVVLFPAELAGNKYKIGALVATDKNKLAMSYTTVTVQGAPAPPAPGPGPGPTPGPASEATLAVQGGMTADGGNNAANLASAKKLASVLRVMATKVTGDTTLKTPSDVYALWKQSVANLLQNSEIPLTRGSIGGYFNKHLPSGQAAIVNLDAPTRQLIATEFNNIAQALESLK